MHIRSALLLSMGLLSSPVIAAEFTVDQKDKSFSHQTLAVKIGDKVNFQNSDPFFHNVFSLSDAKTFDLGSYPAGQARSVTFNKPGTVTVECAIHPQMQMKIEVQE